MKAMSILKQMRLLDVEILELEKILKRKKEEYELGNFIQSKNKYSRDGMYSTLHQLSKYERKWKNSFYVTHRKIAEAFSNASLDPEKQELYKRIHKSNPFHNDGSYSFHTYVLHCEMVMSTGEGPILKLTDPFGSIFSNPLKNTSYEVACSWVKKMLVVDLGHHFNYNNYPIKRIQVLKFELYDI